MKRAFLILFFLLCSCTSLNKLVQKDLGEKNERNIIDIVLVLDLSGSTNELVDAFKKQIWDIILEFSNLQPVPQLRLALIGTGRAYYTKEASYVKILSPLTTNIDEFSNKLYDIESVIKVGKPNNVNTAIISAIHDINWSAHPDALKLLYVVGNGRLGSGTYNAYNAAEEAKNAGIIVNAVFCVNQKNMEQLPEWKLMADLGQGHFFTFNPSSKITFYDTAPELQSMKELNTRLNSTYVSYTYHGEANRQIQQRLDSLTLDIHPVVFQARTLIKASPLYQHKNASWDLTDYYANYTDHPMGPIVYINKTIRKKMPDRLRNMGQEEFRNLLVRKEQERQQTVKKMRELGPVLLSYTLNDKKKLKLKEAVTIKDILAQSLNQYLDESSYIRPQ